jgi:hypothetical protein
MLALKDETNQETLGPGCDVDSKEVVVVMTEDLHSATRLPSRTFQDLRPTLAKCFPFLYPR